MPTSVSNEVTDKTEEARGGLYSGGPAIVGLPF